MGSAMRVTFKTEGGVAHFPGLARPVCIDTEDLSPDEAQELEQRVRDARLFEADGAAAGRGAAARDARCHTITVEEGEDRRTARVCDPAKNPEVGSLVSLLEAHRRRTLREAEPR